MAIIDLSKPDPHRNRRNGLIMALIVVIYLACIVKCAGQCVIRSKPYDNYPNVTRILACDGLQSEPVNDRIVFVGIYADSVKPNVFVPIIYVFLPSGVKINNPDILITFENGDIVSDMKVQVNDSSSNYIEFTCKDPYFSALKNSKINMIHVMNNGVGYYIFEEYEGDYNKMAMFYEFMRSL